MPACPPGEQDCQARILAYAHEIGWTYAPRRTRQPHRHDLWRTVEAWYYDEHKDIFDRLDVPAEKQGDQVLCRFDEASIRAYQLLHILLHELGHHHDRMTTRSQRQACRGEQYAEAYARI